MAAGDIINDVVAVGPSSTNDFQPAAGVEIIITQIGISDSCSNNSRILMYDGTNESEMYVHSGSVMNTPVLMKMGITNSNYLRMKNNDGAATERFSYTGLQIK